MNPELVIEPINSKNFNDFLFLIEKLAEYEKLTPPDAEAKIRLKEDGLEKEPKYEAYLALLDGKAVGYLIFFMTYSSFVARKTLYLEDIFVLEEHRREGIGQKLFEFCVKLAKDRDCGRLEFCVLNWNEPAIRFYEKNHAERLDWIFYRLDREKIKNYSFE